VSDKEDQRTDDAAGEESLQRLREQIPRQSFLELLPKRSLVKAAMLLLLLLAIVFFKGRAANIVRRITDIAMPPPANSDTPARVRLAPPKGVQP